MKTQKTAETEITASKKKLKQARLPFKLLSDGCPTIETIQTRKRKLSTPETEPITKVGKITTENDTVHDFVVISDEDSKEGNKIQDDDKTLNPFVKLVDSAWKKKLQRNKSSRKKKNAKKGLSDDDNKNTDNNEKKSISLCMDVDNAESDDKVPTKSNKVNVLSVNTSRSLINNEETNKTISIVDSNRPNNPHLKNDEVLTQKCDKSTENDINSSNVINNESTYEDICSLSPNRSGPNKSKTIEASVNESSICDESNNSITTPKHNTRNSSISSNLDVSLNNSNTLTPKRQPLKKVEIEKKKEEREKEKQEREKKKQLEKEERARHKQEKEEQKKKEREEKEEVKRKEKEEKEEQRRKEREEKERQKELEKKLKEEKEKQKKKDKEEKEEIRRKEREAKEEEKRKKK